MPVTIVCGTRYRYPEDESESTCPNLDQSKIVRAAVDVNYRSSRGTQIHFTRASATEKRTVGSCNEAATAFAGSFGRYTRPRRRRQCRFQGRSRLSIASESRDPGLAIDIPKEEHSGGFLELIDRGKGPGKLDQRGAEEGNTR